MAECVNACNPCSSINLGCIGPCDTLQTTFDAEYTGVHLLTVDYMGAKVVLSSTVTEFEPITFDVTGLNESFTFTGIVTGPNDGNFGAVTFTVQQSMAI